MSDVQQVIDNISDLPTLPDVVAKLNRLIQDPNTSAGDINDVISRDISLSAKILKLVNSPFYGFPRRITTITYAVVILGFNAVRNLALSAFVFDSFKKKGVTAFDLKGFWRHGICTAIAAQSLAKKTKLWQEEEAFMAGLLHGIGLVVMNQHLTADLTKVMAVVKQKDCLIRDAETELLPYTHNELGAQLLEKWNLPQPIVDAARFHAAPMDSENAVPLCALVHAGEILSRSLRAGFPGDYRIPKLDPEAWKSLELSWDDAGRLLDQTADEFNRAGAFFELA